MEPGRAFSWVTSSYYRGAPNEVVLAALEHMLVMLEQAGWPENHRLNNLLYIFCRIAQLSPEVRRDLAAKQTTLTGRGGDLVRMIILGAEDATFPNALTQQIVDPGSLDLLWAEFFVTGAREPLLRIVGTLDAPDGIRRLLDAWLQERSWFRGGKRAAVTETLRSVGLVLDLKSRTIITDGDLDCLCFALAETKVPIFKLLPCALPQPDLLNLCVKGSALWSMRLNSCDHDLVRTVCQEEHARPGGSGRARLIEPIHEQKPFAL